MAAVRQDAWSPDDDLILAEVTLRHIREGGTQLKAFEEVGERIGRTAAACGFRWNSCVRKKYEAAIQIAKNQRKKRNQMKKKGLLPPGEMEAGPANHSASKESAQASSEELPAESENPDLQDRVAIETIIRHLRKWKSWQWEAESRIRQLEKELREKNEELERLREENEKLNSQVNEVQSDYRTVNDDYKALIQIMDRARKLAFLAEEEDGNRPRFKMDANGNLERVE